MGFFGSGDKNQSTTNTQVGASEESQLAYGTAAVTGKDDSVSLGGYGSKNTLGSDLSGGQGVANGSGLAFGGYGNSNVLGGVDLGGSNSGTITINGAAGAKELADKFASTLESVTNQNSGTVASALEKVTALSESKQTGGVSGLSKTALWGAAIIGGVFIFSKWIK